LGSGEEQSKRKLEKGRRYNRLKIHGFYLARAKREHPLFSKRMEKGGTYCHVPQGRERSFIFEPSDREKFPPSLKKRGKK